MEHEGMVHALEEIHRVLRSPDQASGQPGGLLLDLRPVSGDTPIEVVRPGRLTELAGYFDEPSDHPDDVAANNSVARAVRRGLFHRERDGQFRFTYYWDSVDEMRDYVKEKWTATRLPSGVSRKARRMMAAGDGRVRASVRLNLTKLRKV
jgi:hypothetical protein